MDGAEFWALIERAEGDERALEELLRGRSKSDLIDFDREYRTQLARAYRWDLWGAGYVINGGMSDDSFDYFCDWLIGRGQAAFEAALGDPDSLADDPEVEEDATDAEGLRYAVQRAYEATHSEELPRAGFSTKAGGPAGDEWDEDELPDRFPRLTARFD